MEMRHGVNSAFRFLGVPFCEWNQGQDAVVFSSQLKQNSNVRIPKQHLKKNRNLQFLFAPPILISLLYLKYHTFNA